MELRVVTIEDIVIVEAPHSVCLYGNEAQTVINQLILLAGKLQNNQKEKKNLPKAIVLLQLQEATDFVESWEREIKYEGTQRQTYENILEFRWLLYLIRHSSVPWYYMSWGNVLGSHWELALSCAYRYCFSMDTTYGFPEIAAGIFVAGGVLESLAKHGVKSKEKWQAQNTISVNQALREGMVHCCLPEFFYDYQSEKISFSDRAIQNKIYMTLKMRLENPSLLRHSPALSSFGMGNALDLFLKRSSSSKLSRIDPSLKEEFYSEFHHRAIDFVQQSNKSHVTAWNYCWEIVNERNNAQRPLKSAAAVTRVASMAYYSKNYLNWLSRQRVKVAVCKSPKRNAVPGSSERFGVTIDITDGYPPIAALIKLAGRAVVTFQSRASSQELKQSLEILFSRLDRTIGHAAAAKLWGTQILWTQGQFQSQNFIKLKWIGYDSLHFQIGDRKEVKKFRAIGVDLGGINANYYVASESSWDLDLEEILEAVSQGTIYVKSHGSQVPWESVFRSLALAELIDLARSSGGDLPKVCENLRRLGWGYVADEEAWSCFLKAPEDLMACKTGFEEIDQLIHDNSQFLWEIGSWKQARALARKESYETFTNPVMQSRKLAFFIGWITSLVAKALPADNTNAIDQIAMISLGFPDDCGSPLSFLDALGKRRENWFRQKNYGS